MVLKIVERTEESESQKTVVDKFLEKHGKLALCHQYFTIGDILNFTIARSMDSMICDTHRVSTITESYDHLLPLYNFAVIPFSVIYSRSRIEMKDMFTHDELEILLNAIEGANIIPQMLGEHIVPLVIMYFHKHRRAKLTISPQALQDKLRALPIWYRLVIEVWATIYWWHEPGEIDANDWISHFGDGIESVYVSKLQTNGEAEGSESDEE